MRTLNRRTVAMRTVQNFPIVPLPFAAGQRDDGDRERLRSSLKKRIIMRRRMNGENEGKKFFPASFALL